MHVNYLAMSSMVQTPANPADPSETSEKHNFNTFQRGLEWIYIYKGRITPYLFLTINAGVVLWRSHQNWVGGHPVALIGFTAKL